MTAALTQRARLLQEENDELYELLKLGETGKFKEEVYGLRKVVEKLQGALQGSRSYFHLHFPLDSDILYRIPSSHNLSIVCIDFSSQVGFGAYS